MQLKVYQLVSHTKLSRCYSFSDGLLASCPEVQAFQAPLHFLPVEKPAAMFSIVRYGFFDRKSDPQVISAKYKSPPSGRTHCPTHPRLDAMHHCRLFPLVFLIMLFMSFATCAPIERPASTLSTPEWPIESTNQVKLMNTTLSDNIFSMSRRLVVPDLLVFVNKIPWCAAYSPRGVLAD